MNTNRKGTVLVVDDQERNIQVVGTTLSAEGYEVMAASSGEQALSRIAARCPDLVLLDVYMPEIDGFQVCERLRAEPLTSQLPIIFLSAADEKDIIVRALGCGGVDYITKPFNRAELLARVKAHLELKFARDEREKLIREREVFISMMAHDLKNPLGGARFSTQMLVERADELPEAARRLAETADEGVGRALDLIGNFLADAEAASIEQHLHLRAIDLAKACDEAAARHRPQAADKGIELVWESTGGGTAAGGDEAALGRVLDNLIGNAVKFSPAGTRVWLELDPGRRAITVRDEGPGFTETDRVHLYECFMRLSAKPTGGETSTGLGLSVVKRLTEAMGGGVELLDDGRAGAAFTVTLPAADLAGADSTPAG